MYYSEELIEEVRSRKDIVDVISDMSGCRRKAVLILDYVRSIMRNHRLFL